MFQLRGRMRNRRAPISRDEFVARKNFRLEKPLLRLEVIKVQPAVVAHPGGIHGVVLARRLAIDHIFASADDRVATRRAARAKAFRFLQEPDAHLESEVGRGQRADGTDVDGVERIIIFQPFAGMRSQDAVAAAIDEAEHVILRDLLAKADAARAENAALVVKRHPRAELHSFRLFHFVLQET